jgi:hypothetical protein
MKALTVDCELIAQSMRDICRDSNDYFFHKTTGRVICLSRTLMRALAERSGDVTELVPGWEQPMIPLAREIIVLGSKDYVRIPELFGRPEHKWMLEFSETIRGPKLKEKLLVSLKGRESCHRFKDILKEHAEELNRWLVFRQRKWEEAVQSWLESQSILAFVAKSPHRRLAA